MRRLLNSELLLHKSTEPLYSARLSIISRRGLFNSVHDDIKMIGMHPPGRGCSFSYEQPWRIVVQWVTENPYSPRVNRPGRLKVRSSSDSYNFHLLQQCESFPVDVLSLGLNRAMGVWKPSSEEATLLQTPPMCGCLAINVEPGHSPYEYIWWSQVKEATGVLELSSSFIALECRC